MGLSFLMVTLFFLGTVAPSHAWLIYHKPEFKGKVIDGETKEPIEGAVVVVTYSKTTHLPPEAYSSIINVRETLTDKNGEFYISSYTTMIQPLSSEDTADFIIFKPGYGSFPNYRITPPMELSLPAIEEFFSSKIGTEGEIGWDYKTSKKIKVTFGIVELLKLKTREERLKAITFPSGDVSSKDLPLLYKAINEENKRFGLGEVQ
ncbi:MAG: hypothetical protein HZB79_02855 [Deltaproteobacteria bacterium]|nr:hypothetical protein [Deltaproteobacteria bacterium]